MDRIKTELQETYTDPDREFYDPDRDCPTLSDLLKEIRRLEQMVKQMIAENTTPADHLPRPNSPAEP